jgi:hypothetical protein
MNISQSARSAQDRTPFGVDARAHVALTLRSACRSRGFTPPWRGELAVTTAVPTSRSALHFPCGAAALRNLLLNQFR